MQSVNDLMLGGEAYGDALSPHTMERLRLKVANNHPLCGAEIHIISSLIRDAYSYAPRPINLDLFSELLRSIAALCSLYAHVDPDAYQGRLDEYRAVMSESDCLPSADGLLVYADWCVENGCADDPSHFSGLFHSLLGDLPKGARTQVYRVIQPYMPSLYKLARYGYGQQQIMRQRPARRVEHLHKEALTAEDTELSISWSATQFYPKFKFRSKTITVIPSFSEFLQIRRAYLAGGNPTKIETSTTELDLNELEQRDMRILFKLLERDDTLLNAIAQATLAYGDI